MEEGGVERGGRVARRRSRLSQARRLAVAVALLVLVTGVGVGQAGSDSPRDTTLDHTIVGGPQFGEVRDAGEEPFVRLVRDKGSPVVVRDELAEPGKGRAKNRRSLAYFAQLTDFQLADEESPARVEFADPGASSAWRPQEAFHPAAIDQSVEQLNRLIASPFKAGDGRRARMLLAVLTGDQADNQQYNETLWVRQLIEPGSKLDPGSGIQDFSSCDPVARAALEAKGLDEEPNYVGVQDYQDYARDEDYYDPDDPAGEFVNWPQYPGLMDRAQVPFRTTGLKVPSYVVNGNHDTLVQGNEDANQAFELIATSCFKAGATTSPADPGDEESPNPNLLTSPAGGQFVPPDPDRRFVSKGEARNIFSEGKQKDDHGFAFVDADEDGPTANRGNAWYYAWKPQRGFRFIAIDTVSEGGNVQDSSQGNIDNPQFEWLRDELEDATAKDELVVIFGHHPIRSLNSATPDENAPPCLGGYDEDGNYTGIDRDPKPGHNHALNPGCDPDVRVSSPVHGEGLPGEDLDSMLVQFPNVIAYVPGHTHENRISPCGHADGGCPDGVSGFWELNTSAVADWPQQNRIIDIMDNRDGTLSIFSAVVDHGSRIGIPRPGRANRFSIPQLGGLGRTFSYNDPQSSRLGNSEGDPGDRNVELLIGDPRNAAQAGRRGGEDEGGEDEPAPETETTAGD